MSMINPIRTLNDVNKRESGRIVIMAAIFVVATAFDIDIDILRTHIRTRSFVTSPHFRRAFFRENNYASKE